MDTDSAYLPKLYVVRVERRNNWLQPRLCKELEGE
jgi:hypothetical protein